MDAQGYITKLGLISHVEGGAFKEVYRADAKAVYPELMGHSKERNLCTSIYFLLQHGEFSAFHRIKSDELWHHYDGAVLHIYEIKPSGELGVHRLGKDLANGEQMQTWIAAGSWFASRCELENNFALVGCTVAPGFDFEDFDLAQAAELTQAFPEHAALITTLCRL
ncbi:MAG: cupin domain-containing protein [Bacteroidetes bacterium]|nr:MAG: cupin domain-containing protein [Bacteroidota bacterium]